MSEVVEKAEKVEKVDKKSLVARLEEEGGIDGSPRPSHGGDGYGQD